ncbi:GntR family transcriptional regulator [Brachybacterium sp. p3-SID1565]|uniref:GntR family transcriptional regulator n=1 Tax=Brachybacterium sp. p3-SID1565 TaxID=2916046 RepID=UPI0021A95AB6|nr:GntR family transcriptional regulator [Brachybacterium sp. p3-SID1565]MCT1384209.1 GntR family transcriptional regulator [Brachybacterium sp. p3-SID1565]
MSTLVVDLEDPTPPYEQIRRAILDQVASGVLVTGDRLPAIRTLAGDLGLAPGTVARAYKELEESGVLITRRGAGTRIAEGAPVAEFNPDLQRLADDVVGAARSEGFGDEAILEAVRRALRAGPGSGSPHGS